MQKSQENQNKKEIVEINTSSNQKVKISKEKQYFVWKDTNFLWTILILFLCFFITISFLNIKWLTTLHSYTINILFGMFSILFYVFLLLFCLKKMFNLKNTYSLNNIFHFSLWRLAIFFLGILIFGSTIYFVAIKIYDYSFKNVFKVLFNSWFNTFKNGKNVYLPYKYNAGIIGTFLYGIISMVGKKTGIVLAFIFSLLILAITFSLFFISDLRFKTLSINKEKRNKAKEELSNSIQNNKYKYNKSNIFTNIFKLDSTKTNTNEKIININNSSNQNQEEIIINNEQEHSDNIDWINENDKHINSSLTREKSNEITEINNENIQNKFEKTSLVSINLEAEEITQNIPKKFEKTNLINDYRIETINEETKENTITNTIKTGESQIAYDDSPFYTTTFEAINIVENNENEKSNSSNNEFKEKNIEKTAEEYISKTININTLKRYENSINKPIDLEKQEKNIKILNDTKDSISTTDDEIKIDNSSKKRYSIIEDKEDLF